MNGRRNTGEAEKAEAAPFSDVNPPVYELLVSSRVYSVSMTRSRCTGSHVYVTWTNPAVLGMDF